MVLCRCIAGRVCNRIKDGKFSLPGLNSTMNQYQLECNNGPNALHGGIKGFDQKVWKGRLLDEEEVGVEFVYVSEHQEEYYPSTLMVRVTYLIGSESNSLTVNFHAEFADPKESPVLPTIVNLTNHSYCKINLIKTSYY